MKRLSIIWLAPVVIVVAPVIWLVRDHYIRELPLRLTYERMIGIKERILAHCYHQRQLPKDLLDLPPPSYVGLPGGPPSSAVFPNSGCSSPYIPPDPALIEDGWGRKIIYDVEQSETVMLKSLGRDGSAGGTGANTDIICGFHLHDYSGWLNTHSTGWDYDSRYQSYRTERHSLPLATPRRTDATPAEALQRRFRVRDF